MAQCTQLCTTKKNYLKLIKNFLSEITLFDIFSLLFQKKKSDAIISYSVQ